jgi:hypothetical protein
MICARCKEERPITHLVKSDIIADFVCEACAAAARGLEPPLQVERLPRVIGELDITVLKLLAVWVEFRMSHDLESPKLQCCEKSAALFDALRDFEAVVTGDKKHGRDNSFH